MCFELNLLLYLKVSLANDPKAIFQTAFNFYEKPIAAALVQQGGWSRHPGACHLIELNTQIR